MPVSYTHLFDLKKMRPIKIPKEIAKAYQKEKAIYEEKSHKYDDEFTNLEKIQIRYADIDTNYHVNNASYMDLLREITKVKDQDIEFINIVYKNEIRNKKYIPVSYTHLNCGIAKKKKI